MTVLYTGICQVQVTQQLSALEVLQKTSKKQFHQSTDWQGNLRKFDTPKFKDQSISFQIQARFSKMIVIVSKIDIGPNDINTTKSSNFFTKFLNKLEYYR